MLVRKRASFRSYLEYLPAKPKDQDKAFAYAAACGLPRYSANKSAFKYRVICANGD